MNIYIDIETCPTSAPATIEAIRANIKPPGNYRKPETIAAWMETEGEAAALDAIARTALDAAHGQVIVIGFATDDSEPQVFVREHGEDEAVFMQTVFEAINQHLQAASITDGHGVPVWDERPYFIAHNAAFDLGFLWRRCAVLGVRPPFTIPGPSARAGKDYGCTMQAWAGYGQRISLQSLCVALGLPDPKENGNGTLAWQWWLEDASDPRIATYNHGDVEAVWAIWHRLRPMMSTRREVA